MKGTVILVSLALTFGAALAVGAQEAVSPKDEITYVEKLMQARQSYQDALGSLSDYYRRIGDTAKKGWADDELNAFKQIGKPTYLTYTAFVSKEKWTNEYVPEAERLFKDGKEHKDYPDLFGKKRHLEMAIERFTTLLRNYPTSSRVPDTLFLLAEIYEGFYFDDPVRAAKYYDKCCETDPDTSNPARIRAASLYDYKMNDIDSAMKRYKEVVNSSTSPKEKQEASKRLTELQALYPPAPRQERP